MSQEVQSPPDQNLSALLAGIVNDVQDLFRQQVALVKTEVREDLKKTKEAAIPLAIGLWLAVLGSFMLCITVALVLALVLPYWASFAIVGAAVTLVGAGLVYAGKKKFESFNPLPDESAEALKENLEWIAKPK
jgi:uncharacterized membrane protein YjjP (DUF1212 family)